MFGILSLLLLGCPEPVDQKVNSNNQNSPSAGNGEVPSQGNNGTPTTLSGEQNKQSKFAPPSMGTFPGNLQKREVKPKYTQKELKKKGGVIHGYVKCDKCSGQILLRVLPPPPEEGESSKPGDIQLVTQHIIEKPGAFSLWVPNKTSVVLQVVDDTDGDGQPSQGERMGMRGSGPLKVDGVVEGIELTVGIFPQKEPTGQTPPPTPSDMPTPDKAIEGNAMPNGQGEGKMPPTAPGSAGGAGAAPSAPTPPKAETPEKKD